ncbi:MAG TPA: type II toxin-antitoxin system VapC family toxin [Planctomycetota bacterium]|nr:type II toxin-antitoxin system VapC family toxin [Planctomycetota bacterium]
MILLDTHAWIWWIADEGRLSRPAREAIDKAESIGVSAMSCWEVAMLQRRGRVKLARDALLWCRDAVSLPRCGLVPVTAEIAVTAVQLEEEHRDPADRIIVASAIWTHAQLVTVDSKLHDFKRVKAIW